MGKEYTLGIDLGGTKILAAVINEKNMNISRVKSKTLVEEGQKKILKRLIKTACQAIEEASISTEQIGCVGLGAPGPVNSTTGMIIEAPNMGFKNLKLNDFIAENL